MVHQSLHRRFSSSRDSFSDPLDEYQPHSPNHLSAFNRLRFLLFRPRRLTWRMRRRALPALATVLAIIALVYFLTPSDFVTAGLRSGVLMNNVSPGPTDRVAASGFTGLRNAVTFSNGTLFKRPPELKIIGIVFYGRRQFVNVLDCYLRHNLAVNGGLLDEVHFLMHTNVEADKNWLADLIIRDGLENEYIQKFEDTSGDWNLWRSFADLYKHFMTDPNAIYIKMDDDILFIDEYTINELVRVTLEHPEAHSVQTNIVNSKWNYWHHLRSNAIWPFLAEQDASSKWPADSWRPSELPQYREEIPTRYHNFTSDYPVPNTGHRWLPLPPTYSNLARTPYGPFLPDPTFHVPSSGVGWAVTAQTHYSLFLNIERRELARYSYGSAHDHTWNQWYTRYNINMFAVRGSTLSLKPFWDNDTYPTINKGDEYILTYVVPRDLDMPVLVATRAVAAHFSFKDDRAQMLRTDILDRYIALANDIVCAPNNRKHNLGRHSGPHHLPGNAPLPEPPTAAAGEQDAVIGDGPQDINAEGEQNDDRDARAEGVENPGPDEAWWKAHEAAKGAPV